MTREEYENVHPRLQEVERKTRDKNRNRHLEKNESYK